MKFRDRISRFMQGRYGTDDFSRFLLIASLILLVIAMFTRRGIWDWLAIGLLIYCYFRILSRNTYKRSAENEKYMSLKNRFLGFFQKEKSHAGQLKEYRFFKCPQCKQKIRVPKGKGKIKIHCPKCHTDFIKKS